MGSKRGFKQYMKVVRSKGKEEANKLRVKNSKKVEHLQKKFRKPELTIKPEHLKYLERYADIEILGIGGSNQDARPLGSGKPGSTPPLLAPQLLGYLPTPGLGSLEGESGSSSPRDQLPPNDIPQAGGRRGMQTKKGSLMKQLGRMRRRGHARGYPPQNAP